MNWTSRTLYDNIYFKQKSKTVQLGAGYQIHINWLNGLIKMNVNWTTMTFQTEYKSRSLQLGAGYIHRYHLLILHAPYVCSEQCCMFACETPGGRKVQRANRPAWRVRTLVSCEWASILSEEVLLCETEEKQKCLKTDKITTKGAVPPLKQHGLSYDTVIDPLPPHDALFTL